MSIPSYNTSSSPFPPNQGYPQQQQRFQNQNQDFQRGPGGPNPLPHQVPLNHQQQQMQYQQHQQQQQQQQQLRQQQQQQPQQPPHQSHNPISGIANKFRRLSISSSSSVSASPAGTPFGSNSPATMEISAFATPPPAQSHSPLLDSADRRLLDIRSESPLPDLPKDTPPEMVPVLTLLTAQQNREYFKGYFMLLNDLTSHGKTVPDRKWTEVFGKLTGTVLSIWDAASLEGTLDGKDPTPTYINISDSTFKSIPKLPSPSGDLENIIVLSTTMKNRYLLQFSATKQFQDWTAALRLSVFEYISLQEAYTGALLSAKGSKLNGIRTLLSETKFRHEEWCRVRFGAGMPWKKCWAVITPSEMKKKKKMPHPGTISFYEDPKHIKGTPLAVATAGYAAYAIYPEKSVLVNGSTLIKIEGRVIFSDSDGEKDTGIFLMPEQHPGVVGYETLIRFLIPVLDVFKLYGRPQRLNADKSDIRSLLFGMPTLPRCQYLDVVDLSLLVAVSGSDKWSGQDWSKNIKELLARKISTGFRGTGSVHQVLSSPLGSETSSIQSRRDRAVSNPNPPDSRLIADNANAIPATAIATTSPLAIRQMSNSPVPGNGQSGNIPPGNKFQPTGPPRSPVTQQSQQFVPQQRYPSPGGSGPRPPQHAVRAAPPPPLANNNLAVPRSHERSASEGQDPNNLMSTVGPSTQPLSPLVDEYPNNFSRGSPYDRNPPSGSSESFATDEDNRSNSRAGIREDIFGSQEPVDSINSIGARNVHPGFKGAPIAVSQQSQPPNSPPAKTGPIHRRPVSSEFRQGPQQQPSFNMFDPTANTAPPNPVYGGSPQPPQLDQFSAPVRAQSPHARSPLPSPHHQQGPPRSQSPMGARPTGQYMGQQMPRAVGPGPSRPYSPGPGGPGRQQRMPPPNNQQMPPQRPYNGPPRSPGPSGHPPHPQQMPPQQRQAQVDPYGRGTPPPSMFGNARDQSPQYQ